MAASVDVLLFMGRPLIAPVVWPELSAIVVLLPVRSSVTVVVVEPCLMVMTCNV